MLQKQCIFVMEMQINETEYRQSTKLDTAGFIASFICAIHCAVTPLLLASLPLAGIQFFASQTFDIFMISLSFLIASISLFRGYNYHKKYTALAIVTTGFACISMGEFGNMGYTILLTVGGALLVATSHIVNHFMVRNALRSSVS